MKASHALTIFILGMLLCFGIGLLIGNRYQPGPVIDLPEEWMTISKDIKQPDLLVGHISGDTLYLRFDN